MRWTHALALGAATIALTPATAAARGERVTAAAGQAAGGGAAALAVTDRLADRREVAAGTRVTA